MSLRDFFGDMELRSLREATTQRVIDLFGLHVVCFLIVAAPIATNPGAVSCMLSATGGVSRVLLLVLFVAGTCYPATLFSSQTMLFILRYYMRSMSYMTQLRNPRMVVSDARGFCRWLELRRYILHWEVPVLTRAASPALFFVFLATAVLVLAVVINFARTQFVDLQWSSGWRFVIVYTIVCSLYLLRLASYAASLWEVQQSHILLVDSIPALARQRVLTACDSEAKDAVGGGGSNGGGDDTFIALLEQTKDSIGQLDPAPKVMGIPVTPTLYRLVVGYVVGCLACLRDD